MTPDVVYCFEDQDVQEAARLKRKLTTEAQRHKGRTQNRRTEAQPPRLPSCCLPLCSFCALLCVSVVSSSLVAARPAVPLWFVPSSSPGSHSSAWLRRADLAAERCRLAARRR